MGRYKPAIFLASSLDDLRLFPSGARREAGHQIDLVERGEDPDDWKPMTGIGLGVKEIRIRDGGGAFRVIYVAKFASHVFVLHCFEKKTAITSLKDMQRASSRYKSLLLELKK